MRKYLLDENGRPVVEPDTVKWAEWYETADRHIGKDQIGGTVISTVFLGLDHSFSGNGPPVLWETMIFGGEHDEFQRRYTSLEDAIVGHAEAVQLVRKWEKEVVELRRIAALSGFEPC